MGWALGWDYRYKRDIGYGVPAYCDHEECSAEIDRGLGYKCELEECGCGKFYCQEHRFDTEKHTHAKPVRREHPAWMRWKLTDESWQQWRDESPAEVELLTAALTLIEGPTP